MKKFAVVIVNYNCSKDTIDTIKSLEIFDKSIFDIFLVDNFSNKNDLEFLKSNINDDIIFYELKSNL
jgi:GT2 family glycosyltransferase